MWGCIHALVGEEAAAAAAVRIRESLCGQSKISGFFLKEKNKEKKNRQTAKQFVLRGWGASLGGAVGEERKKRNQLRYAPVDLVVVCAP